MGPLLLVRKGLVLRGFFPSKIEVIWVPGIYIFTMTLTIHVWYICLRLADFYGFHVGKYTSPMDPVEYHSSDSEVIFSHFCARY